MADDWSFAAASEVGESFLSLFGPLSLLALLTMWVIGLVSGFALLHWSLETKVNAPEGAATIFSYLYWSGETFFTLGTGDISPTTTLGVRDSGDRSRHGFRLFGSDYWLSARYLSNVFAT